MTLGEKIQTLRKQKGLSQEQLAEKITVSRQAVSKWELSESFPDVDNIVQLSNIFDVSTDYLLRNDAAVNFDSPISQPETPKPAAANKFWDDEDEDEDEDEEEPTTIRGFFRAEIYFIALIAFLIIGFVWDAWHPGWIVFVLASVIDGFLRDKSSFIVYVAATAVFLFAGYTWGAWHPGWIVFLIASLVAQLIRIINKNNL